MASFTGGQSPPSPQDSFIGSDTEADSFRFTPLTLEAADTVVGGGGAFTDALVFTQAGTIATARLAGVTGIERIIHDAGGNSYALTQALVAAAFGGTLEIRGGAGTDVVDGSAVLDPLLSLAFIAGGGADSMTGGAGADSFSVLAAAAVARLFAGGGGDDVLTTRPGFWTATDSFQGGAGADRILFDGAGVVTAAQLAGLASVETIALGNAVAITLTLDTAAVAQAGGVLTVLGGKAAAQSVDATAVAAGGVAFLADDGADSFLGGTGADLYETGSAAATGALGAGDDTLRLRARDASGLVVDGGAGEDDIELATGGFWDLRGLTNFEGVSLPKRGELLLGATPGMRVLGSIGADKITLGGAGQTVFGFGGDDTVLLTAASLLGAVLNGGAHIGGDTLVMTASGLYDFRRAAVTGFERFELDRGLGAGSTLLLPNQALDLLLGSAASVTLGAHAGQSVAGSRRADSITLGAAGQFVETGGGDDVIRATAAQLLAGTVIAGGAGALDLLQIIGGGAVDLTAGAVVLDVERIELAAATSLVLDAAPGLVVTGSAGNDAVTAGAEGLTGDLGGGDDLLRIPETMLGPAGIGAMLGGSGIDTLLVQDVATTTEAIVVPARFAGFERLDLGAIAGQTVSIGGSTNWEVLLGSAPIIVNGGSGNETFRVAATGQQVAAGLGDDTISFDWDTAFPFQLDGGPGVDEIRATHSDPGSLRSVTMPTGWSVETLRLFGQHLIVTNGQSGLRVIGDPALATIFQLAGSNQRAEGGAGADQLQVIGGSNNTLAGGNGDDTYVIRPGDPWSTPGQTIVDNANTGNINVIVFDSAGTVQIDFNQHAVSHIDRMLVTAAAAQVNLTISNAMVSTADGSNGTLPGDLFIFASVAVTAGATINGSGLLGPNLLRFAGIDGGAFNGADTVSGGAGSDFLISGAGSDSLSGNDGSDTLQGEGDNDTLQGQAGDDSLLGGAGNDSLVAGTGGDTMLGGSGADRIVLGTVDTASDRLRYTASTDGSPDLNDATSVTESAADLVFGFDPSLDRIELSRSGLGLGAGGVVNVAANGAWDIGSAAVFIFESDSGNSDVLSGNNFANLDQVAFAVNTDNTQGAGSSAGRTVALVVSNLESIVPRRTGIYVWTDTDGNSDLQAGDVVTLLAVIDGVTANQLAAAGSILIG